VEFVGEGLREGIVEDGHDFTEVDSMLAEVGGGLGWIELEVETSEWHREVVCDILTRVEAAAQSAKPTLC
jgi:predicted alpha/beta-fold hydrolase